MKRFFTVKDIQRGSQSYMKKRRGRRDIEMSRRRKRGDSRGERQIYAVVCSQSVLCSPVSVAQTPTKIDRIGLGREGERRK